MTVGRTEPEAPLLTPTPELPDPTTPVPLVDDRDDDREQARQFVRDLQKGECDRSGGQYFDSIEGVPDGEHLYGCQYEGSITICDDRMEDPGPVPYCRNYPNEPPTRLPSSESDAPLQSLPDGEVKASDDGSASAMNDEAVIPADQAIADTGEGTSGIADRNDGAGQVVLVDVDEDETRSR